VYRLFSSLGGGRCRSCRGARWYILLSWSPLRCRSLYQPAVTPRLPYPSWTIESLEDWRGLQLRRRLWGHVLLSHLLVGKAGTPRVMWGRSACRELLGLHWRIWCPRLWRRWTTNHVAKEIIQVPSRRLLHVGCWSERGCYALRYSCCSTKGICLLYPTSRGCSGVQNRSTAVQTHQPVMKEVLPSGLTK
jgi:hypothetical protein